MLKRREFLFASTALLMARPVLAAADATVLTAGVTEVQLAPDGFDRTELWCFDGISPGPEIRVPQGGPLARRFQNDLPEPSAVHWHGIRLNNAMDGVPALTQDVLKLRDSAPELIERVNRDLLPQASEWLDESFGELAQSEDAAEQSVPPEVIVEPLPDGRVGVCAGRGAD